MADVRWKIKKHVNRTYSREQEYSKNDSKPKPNTTSYKKELLGKQEHICAEKIIQCRQ